MQTHARSLSVTLLAIGCVMLSIAVCRIDQNAARLARQVEVIEANARALRQRQMAIEQESATRELHEAERQLQTLPAAIRKKCDVKGDR